MRALNGLRRSPAAIVTAVALVAALAGTAVAVPEVTTSVSKKKTKKIAAKQAQKYFDANISSASVGSAQTANSADSATESDFAEVAGGPVAVGHIANPFNGNVNPARTRGFTSANVSSPDTGSYCFDNLDFTFRTANVTTDFNASENFTTAQIGLPRADGCPPGTEAEVTTAFQDGDGGVFEDSGFFIAFYR